MHYSDNSQNQITCLVYGGAGFLGYKLCKLLLDQGCKVLCVDNFSIGRFKIAKRLSASSNFFFFPKSFEKFNVSDFKQIDYIFSLVAAEIRNNDVEGGVYGFISNSFNSHKLLEINDQNKSKLLFLFSSKAHYSHIVTSEDQQKCDVFQVAQDYSENNIKNHKLNHGSNVRIARVSNVYGPGMNLNSDNIIAHLLKEIFQNQKIYLSNDGLQNIYPTYIDDVVGGVAKAMFAQSTDGKIFNLINSKADTPLSLTYLIKNLYGVEIETSFKPKSSNWNSVVSQQDLENTSDLSWVATTDTESGIVKTIEFLNSSGQINTNHLQKTSKTLENKKEEYVTSNSDFSQNQTMKLKPETLVDDFVVKNKPATSLQTYSSKTISLKKDKESSKSKLSPSVVTQTFLQRFTSLVSKKNPKKKKNPPKNSFTKILYFVVPALLLLTMVFGPDVLLKQNINLNQSRIKKIEENFSNQKPIDSRLIGKIENSLKSAQILSQIVSWKGNISGKTLDSNIQGFLEFTPRLLSYFINQNNINQNYQQLKQIMFGQESGDIELVYQSTQSNISQAQQNLQLLLTQLEKRSNGSDLKNKVDFYLSQINQQSRVLDILPTIISFEDKQQALILIQDNMELRPTGGFISAVGVLTSQNGKVVDWEVKDVYEVDTNLKGRVIPPAEFQKYQFENNWYFRDLNFSPNFSCNNIDIEGGQHCTAGDAIWFSKQSLGIEPSIVVAVNLNTLSQLLSSLGSISFTDYNETIDAYNLLERAKSHAQTDKNDFVVSLTQSIFDRLQNTDSYTFASLINDFALSLNHSDTLIYSLNSSQQKKIEDYFWSGSLRVSPDKLVQFGEVDISDYFAIYESNFSYRKNNYYTQNSLVHNVNISKAGEILVNSEFTIQNNATTQTWPSGNYDKNYLRYILPQNSSLSSILIKPQAGTPYKLSSKDIDRKTEGSYRSVGFLLKPIPVKEEVSIVLSYKLKNKLDLSGQNLSNYSLYLQKQPGSYNAPFQIVFNLDSGISLEKISPTPDSKDGNPTFSGIFDQDKIFVLSIK